MSGSANPGLQLSSTVGGAGELPDGGWATTATRCCGVDSAVEPSRSANKIVNRGTVNLR